MSGQFVPRRCLEIAPHDARNSIDLGHLEDVGRRRLPLAKAVPQRLDGDVGAYGVAVADAISDRFRRVRHLHDHAFDLVLLHAGGERRAGRPKNAMAGGRDGWAVGGLLDHDPDGRRHLRRQTVILEGRYETDDHLRLSLGDGGDVGVAGGGMVLATASLPTRRVSNAVRTKWPRRPQPACLVDMVARATPLHVWQNADVPAWLSRRSIHDARS